MVEVGVVEDQCRSQLECQQQARKQPEIALVISASGTLMELERFSIFPWKVARLPPPKYGIETEKKKSCFGPPSRSFHP